jgi:hypothetical protein
MARGKLQHGAFLPLAAGCWSVTQNITCRRGFASTEILRHWEHIVGTHLGVSCRPEHLRYIAPRRADGAEVPGEAILTIRAEGAAALELPYAAPQIIERINSYFGFRAVGQIKILQGPLPRRKRPYKRAQRKLSREELRRLDERLSGIANPALRRALYRLGEGVLATSERAEGKACCGEQND